MFIFKKYIWITAVYILLPFASFSVRSPLQNAPGPWDPLASP